MIYDTPIFINHHTNLTPNIKNHITSHTEQKLMQDIQNITATQIIYIISSVLSPPDTL